MAHRLNIGPKTPAECGSADAYYSGGRWYGYKLHCDRDWETSWWSSKVKW